MKQKIVGGGVGVEGAGGGGGVETLSLSLSYSPLPLKHRRTKATEFNVCAKSRNKFLLAAARVKSPATWKTIFFFCATTSRKNKNKKTYNTNTRWRGYMTD